VLASWKVTLVAGVFVVGCNSAFMFLGFHYSKQPSWLVASAMVSLASVTLLFGYLTWKRYKEQRNRPA